MVVRKTFSGLMVLGGRVVHIKSGPLVGVRLVVSDHVSHAHVAGTYELETQSAIDRLISPGCVCYDLGASIGYMTLLMARKAKHVFAFEPAPHAASELREHADANGFGNISIVRNPVSDCERSVEFGLTDNAYGSRIVESQSKWLTLRLRTITLDSFVTTHPFLDFIKIDIEGEEGRALQGSQSILRKKKTLICCEIHSEEAAHQVQGILSQHGYRISTLSGEPFQVSGPIVPGEVQILAFPP